MNDHMSDVLDGLVPAFADERGDWERIVRDARVQTRRRVRRVAIAAVVLAAIAIPLAALAASQDWWFFRFGRAPTPVTGVAIVKRGTWSGKHGELVAYRSATDGLCFSMTPLLGHGSTGAGMSCDQIAGVPRTPRSKPYTPHGMTYLAGSSAGFPPYIVGPVVEAADVVVIHLATGRIVRTRTFDAPKALGAAIRFYAARLEPRDLPPVRRPAIEKLVGLDDRGRIVTCLLPRMPAHGVPLSACR